MPKPTAPAAHRARTRAPDEGITLIEMVVALGILLGALVTLVAALLGSQKAQQISEGTDRATQIAQSRIERIRQLDWADIGFYSNTYGSPPSEYATYRPAGESNVMVGPTDPNTGLNVIQPYYVDNSLKNPFKVYTYITWGSDSSLGLPTTSGTGTYSFKRVKVVVDWTAPSSAQKRLTINETWFAPDSEDAVPPGVTVTTAP